MNGEIMLNKIEHNLLTMQVYDSEPLFILVSDTMRDCKEATIELILSSLLRLIELGFSECIRKEGEDEQGSWKPCNTLTIKDLTKRFEGQSETEKLKYPSHTNEYYFRITEAGRKEERKSIYDSYYT